MAGVSWDFIDGVVVGCVAMAIGVLVASKIAIYRLRKQFDREARLKREDEDD